MPFPGVTIDQAANAAVPVEVGGILSGVGAMMNPVAGILSGIGGISSMFGGGSGMDVSKAVSGGTFYAGDISTEKTGTTIVIIAAIILGLFLILRKK